MAFQRVFSTFQDRHTREGAVAEVPEAMVVAAETMVAVAVATEQAAEQRSLRRAGEPLLLCRVVALEPQLLW